MTGGEAVAATLEALGVNHVFGIVSVHNLPVYDAIARRGNVTAVTVRHEQGAAHAADGFARATGGLGVAITSTGPGAANAMGGLFEAAFASSPVLMITGQIESTYLGKGRGALPEAERQLDMLRAVTRSAVTVRRPADIPRTVAEAALDALTGRPQPVAVEIPIDLQYAEADVDIPAPTTLVPPRAVPDAAAVTRAAEALYAAERPLLWAGGGVLRAGAEGALLALAEHLQAPVLTSLSGRGAIPEDHPLAVGAMPTAGPIAAVISEADVVLAVGTRFQGGDTRNWQLEIPGTLVHVDADPGVVDRNYRAAVPVIGDALPALEGIAEELGGGAGCDAAFLQRAQAAAEAARTAARDLIGADHAAVMDAIRELAPRDANLVRDATVPAYLWGDRLLPVLEPRTSMRPASAAIGPGLPLGVGAALGSGRPTVVIHGDGGIMLTLAELATAAEHNAPLTVCVFNDGGYGVLRAIQASRFEGRQTGVDLLTPDFVAVATAMGVTAERVEGVEQFRAAFGRAMETTGPSLLDIDMAALAPMGMFGRPRPAAGASGGA